jgi:hypothetical protein
MTVLGKILTFVILVLAIVQVAFHVMFHVAQVNYASAFEKSKDQLTATRADADQSRKDAEAARAERDALLAKFDAERKDLEKQVADAKSERDDIKQLADQLKTQVATLTTDQKASSTDIARRQDEFKRLEESNNEKDARIKSLTETSNEQRKLRIETDLANQSLKHRNELVEGQLEEMSKEMIALKKSGGTGAIPGTSEVKKTPPPNDVEGLVLKTDPTGLISVSIGSDSGVLKGHTLEVFRLQPTPKYLGTIKITDVRPNEAVGRPMGKPLGTIMEGDHVAAKILGS